MGKNYAIYGQTSSTGVPPDQKVSIAEELVYLSIYKLVQELSKLNHACSVVQCHAVQCSDTILFMGFASETIPVPNVIKLSKYIMYSCNKLVRSRLAKFFALVRFWLVRLGFGQGQDSNP